MNKPHKTALMSVRTASIARFNNTLPKELKNPWIKTGILLISTTFIYHSLMLGLCERVRSWFLNSFEINRGRNSTVSRIWGKIKSTFDAILFRFTVALNASVRTSA